MYVVISQPRYLPIISYLQRIYFSDHFVLLDNVQRQSRGYENRNKLFLPNLKWLTIPISSSSREVIFNTKISSNIDWVNDHKQLITQFYKKHPFFDEFLLDKWFSGIVDILDFTQAMKLHLENICDSINVEPNFIRASDLIGRDQGYGIDNLFNIIKSIKGTDKVYVSGSNGRDYGILEADHFANHKTIFHDWKPSEYFQYRQENFHPYMPFLDYVFNEGIEKLESLVKEKQVFSNE